MALPQEQDRVYTTDDIYNLPEGVRAELIDGQIYYMAPPNDLHQEIVGELYLTIGNYIKSKSGKCKIRLAPYAVYLNKDNKNHVEPDISIICDPSKLDNDGCHGAPDFIIEVVSPGSKQRDRYTKLFKYRTAKVREYWIVDPLKKSIGVHFFEDEDSPYQYTFKDKIKVNIYDDLYIDFSELNI